MSIEAKSARISFCAALALALFTLCASVEANPPTCNHPVGKWQNRQKSVLEIKTYDAATGALAGEYISRSGASAGPTPYPVVGWINTAPAESGASGKADKGNHAMVVTFAVRWGTLGSVSAWTGTCAVNAQSSGPDQISALWHTTRPNTGFEWDHTLTGSDRFDPVE
jgi:hypothetical protein